MKVALWMLLGTFLTSSAYEQTMVVSVPVASIRTVPIDYVLGTEHDVKASQDMFGRFYERFIQTLPPQLRDPAQDSQVLYNENIICLENLSNGWLKIKLPEQYGYSNSKKDYEHVVGYIKRDQLQQAAIPYKTNLVVKKPWTDITLQDGTSLTVPMGTKLYSPNDTGNQSNVTLPDGRRGTIKTDDIYYIKTQATEPEMALRSTVVNNAQQLVGGPLCWGGRSPHSINNLNCAPSCDCSGLINLAYRACGLELPRNSHPMWLRSAKIEHGSLLKPGDLIFFAYPDRPGRINHVLMYLGNEKVIESCLAKGIAIRETQERFGKPVATVRYGDIIKTSGSSSTEYVLYFGSYLGDRDRIQYMRDYALGNYDVTRWVKDDQTGQNGTTDHTYNHLNK